MLDIEPFWRYLELIIWAIIVWKCIWLYTRLYDQKWKLEITFPTKDESSKIFEFLLVSDTEQTVSISIGLCAKNDETDWISGFYGDYGRKYNTPITIASEIKLQKDIPYTLQCSFEELSSFTKSNIVQYTKDLVKNDLSPADDLEIFKDSFLHPNWELILYINGVSREVFPVTYRDVDIDAYIQSLSFS